MTKPPLPKSITKRQRIATLPTLELTQQFQPGLWQDRHQVITRAFSAVSGCYQRSQKVSGHWLSTTSHYFDLGMGTRPASSSGHFDHGFDHNLPIGEILFVPAGQCFHGNGGAGRQRNLFLFLNAEAHAQESELLTKPLPAPVLQSCLDMRSKRIRQLLKEIARELYQPGFASQLMLEGLGTTLLAEVVRLLHQQEEHPKRRGGLSSKALRLINDRIAEEETIPNLQELADLCQLSQRHLMRAFREETGQTVGHYIKQRMMERASNLLRHTDLHITTIAHKVGFSNAAAFSTAFKRAIGKSPREFREMHR